MSSDSVYESSLVLRRFTGLVRLQLRAVIFERLESHPILIGIFDDDQPSPNGGDDGRSLRLPCD
jgi:hypothetical protein